jgi:hypothetical protein
MNYLIKKGQGPNNGVVFSLLNELGADFGIIMAANSSRFSPDLISADLKYVVHGSKSLRAVVVCLDVADDNEKPAVLASINTLLTERKIGDITLADNVTIMVSARENECPDLFSGVAVGNHPGTQVIDFSCGHYQEMSAKLSAALTGVAQEKHNEKLRTHEANDSPSL